MKVAGPRAPAGDRPAEDRAPVLDGSRCAGGPAFPGPAPAGAGPRRPSPGEAPGPGHPQRLALPLHLEAAARALFDDLPAPLPPGDVDRAAASLAAGAEALARRLAPGTELVVDGFRVRAAAGCPAAAAADAAVPFEWSPATAARTVGLRALAYHLRGAAGSPPTAPGRPVEDAVEEVVADLAGRGGERSAGPWLAGLAPPARAVAVAQARCWAEQAAAWLPLRLVGEGELRFLQDDWWPPRGRARSRPPDGGRALVLHGRRDITVEVAGRRVAVTVAGGTASAPGLAEVDGLTALAGVLCDPRSRLVRVVRVHPASGEVVAVDVTGPLLERAVEVVLGTVERLAPATGAGEPPAVPGPACWRCNHRQTCEPGTAWLAGAAPRSMGLPLVSREV